MLTSGLITREQGLSLLDSADTKKLLSSESSRVRAIEIILERALKKGEKPVFYPALGLELYFDKARKMYAELIVEQGEDDPKVVLLTEFLKEMEQKIQAQVQIASPPQVAPAGQQQKNDSGLQMAERLKTGAY